MFRGITKTFLLDVYNGNLKHFTLFNTEFKHHNCPSTTRALVGCAISMDIGVFNERSVLLNNLLNKLCYLYVLNSVMFILSFFTMFYCFLLLWLIILCILYSCAVPVIGLLAVCQQNNNKELNNNNNNNNNNYYYYYFFLLLLPRRVLDVY